MTDVLRPYSTAGFRRDEYAVDGAAEGTAVGFSGIAGGLRRLQNGYVRSYALSLLGGAALVVLALLVVNI